MSPGAFAIRAPASAEESAGITPRERGSHSSGIREATQCTTRHFWPNALFWLRGQMVAYYHGWATVPRRERLQPAPIRRPAMRLEMAVSAWEHMMREQAAYHWMVRSCNASEGDRSDSHWRQPWTPASATLVTEMADQKSFHWACSRHISKVGSFLLLVWRNQHHLLPLTAGFIPCHSGITWASSMILS